MIYGIYNNKKNQLIDKFSKLIHIFKVAPVHVYQLKHIVNPPSDVHARRGSGDNLQSKPRLSVQLTAIDASSGAFSSVTTQAFRINLNFQYCVCECEP